METKTKNGLITVGVITIIGYLAYRFFLKGNKPDNKIVVANYMKATYCNDVTDFVNNSSKTYIDAWAEAIMKGNCTFVDSSTGKIHNTGGGRVKV